MEEILSDRLDPILERFGTWAVTEYGIECIPYDYPIEIARLWEPDWIDHMDRKHWVVIEDFLSALFAAQRRYAKFQPERSTGKWRRLRYEIMRRDRFRCQLCGATAGNGTKLEVDHKHPRALGGDDDPRNLWTLCEDCNRGKSDRLLSGGDPS